MRSWQQPHYGYDTKAHTVTGRYQCYVLVERATPIPRTYVREPARAPFRVESRPSIHRSHRVHRSSRQSSASHRVSSRPVSSHRVHRSIIPSHLLPPSEGDLRWPRAGRTIMRGIPPRRKTWRSFARAGKTRQVFRRRTNSVRSLRTRQTQRVVPAREKNSASFSRAGKLGGFVSAPEKLGEFLPAPEQFD